MEENAIQIKSAIMINAHGSVKNICGKKDNTWNPATCSYGN